DRFRGDRAGAGDRRLEPRQILDPRYGGASHLLRRRGAPRDRRHDAEHGSGTSEVWHATFWHEGRALVDSRGGVICGSAASMARPVHWRGGLIRGAYPVTLRSI